MGSLIDEDLEAIWQNDKFNHFRENYRDTCGSCDLWVIDQVDRVPPGGNMQETLRPAASRAAE
ncbi:MAG: SPASM domain-containing protein [Nitrospinaceae bacterium]|jgi:hypothetical protein|nr:SPASM domain-containing protein [Nitrospinaceae bacterium]